MHSQWSLLRFTSPQTPLLLLVPLPPPNKLQAKLSGTGATQKFVQFCWKYMKLTQNLMHNSTLKIHSALTINFIDWSLYGFDVLFGVKVFSRILKLLLWRNKTICMIKKIALFGRNGNEYFNIRYTRTWRRRIIYARLSQYLQTHGV